MADYMDEYVHPDRRRLMDPSQPSQHPRDSAKSRYPKPSRARDGTDRDTRQSSPRGQAQWSPSSQLRELSFQSPQPLSPSLSSSTQKIKTRSKRRGQRGRSRNRRKKNKMSDNQETNALQGNAQGSSQNAPQNAPENAARAATPGQEAGRKWTEEMASFNADPFLDKLGEEELQKTPVVAHQGLPNHMRPYIQYPKTPMKGDQAQHRTLPSLPPRQPPAIPEGDSSIMPRKENVNIAAPRIAKPAKPAEEIVIGKTVKSLEREGKDYDPAVKALFKNRENENVYVHKPPKRKSALDMLDEVTVKKAKEDAKRDPMNIDEGN